MSTYVILLFIKETLKKFLRKLIKMKMKMMNEERWKKKKL